MFVSFPHRLIVEIVTFAGLGQRGVARLRSRKSDRDVATLLPPVPRIEFKKGVVVVGEVSVALHSSPDVWDTIS